MTASEATDTYNALVRMLREAGLEWVSAQVAQEAATGRTVRKTVSVFGEELTLKVPSRRQRVEFLSTEAYSPRERLHLMLDAIEQTAVGTAEMQRSTLEMLSAHGKVLDVRFASETPEVEEHGYRSTDVEPREVGARKLRSLLNELRRELAIVD